MKSSYELWDEYIADRDACRALSKASRVPREGQKFKVSATMQGSLREVASIVSGHREGLKLRRQTITTKERSRRQSRNQFFFASDIWARTISRKELHALADDDLQHDTLYIHTYWHHSVGDKVPVKIHNGAKHYYIADLAPYPIKRLSEKGIDVFKAIGVYRKKGVMRQGTIDKYTYHEMWIIHRGDISVCHEDWKKCEQLFNRRVRQSIIKNISEE